MPILINRIPLSEAKYLIPVVSSVPNFGIYGPNILLELANKKRVLHTSQYPLRAIVQFVHNETPHIAVLKFVSGTLRLVFYQFFSTFPDRGCQ